MQAAWCHKGHCHRSKAETAGEIQEMRKQVWQLCLKSVHVRLNMWIGVCLMVHMLEAFLAQKQ